ncbi:MAG: hypothetical protein KIT56_11530, partial [Gammaproteobacteria bacterium]|nr:hypothetical protein [Gammaproteobacteria bacterium]
MNIRFLSNTDDNVQVDLPSGKLSKAGVRKPLSAQKGMTCTLFSMRRIAIFDTDGQNKKSLQAYKKIKKALAAYNGNHDELVSLANTILIDLNIDLGKSVLTNKSFMNKHQTFIKKTQINMSAQVFYNSLSSFHKWILLYDVIIKNILMPLMNLKETAWHPREGFAALKKSLKEKGAHFFMGKFGAWCYSKKPILLSKESTSSRQVFYFDKDTYIGDSKPFTHGIIVDQVKIVNGKEMIFFRDPSKASKEGQPEKIYILSYETFVNRLTDMQGYRFSYNECSNDINFGLVNESPGQLYRGVLQKPSKL